MPWQKIIYLIVSGSLSVLLEPMFWVVLALVGYQYWQLQRNQRKMFGIYGYTLKHQVLMAGVYGLVGGIVGSLLLTLVGVTLNQLGLNYIWLAALVLMIIHIRFLCFAYAGGLVALSSLLLGWPAINVPQAMALVAVLHITESVLIAISGRFSAVPLIFRREDGRLVGAFSLQNFWPLPLMLLAAVAIPSGAVPEGMVSMPDWWPLLPVTVAPPPGKEWIFTMVPVVAALGYADMAVSSLPSWRRRSSALHLAVYSILLLIVAVLSARYYWLQYVAAVLSPLGHEFLIQYDNYQELNKPPKFVPPPYGVMVLDTVHDSPARLVQLKPGDIIIAIGGMAVNSRWELAAALSAAPREFTLDVVRKGQVERLYTNFLHGERRLGVILVPTGDEQHYVMLANQKFALWKWLTDKWRKKD